MLTVVAMNDPVTDKFEQLKQRFAERCRTSLRDLIEARADPQRTILIAHSLAGAGGTFGFPMLSEKAARMESLLLNPGSEAVQNDEAYAALVRELEAITG